ncbi:MAG: cytochrome c4 [Bacteroidota bacterium]|nr:MAG: cytochrome c4 [Bacteroidota bacterium]
MNSFFDHFFSHHIPTIISGPCSAETEEQLMETAIQLAQTQKVHILRAGIWKPRTKPGSFEGVGSIGLTWLQRAKKETGLKTAVEVASPAHVELALKHEVDILWIGARTTANPFAVQEIANSLKKVDVIVLVKNPVNPDINLWEGGIERIAKAGIDKLGAIHRGFSTYGNSDFRNPPQWQIPIELKQHLPHIPLFCDPSHICGKTDSLLQIAQKALDLNFNGLMIESHINPGKAWSDAQQQITPNALSKLISHLVIREYNPALHNKEAELIKLCEKINMLDNELFDVLSKRMQTIIELGLYKKQNNIKILQPERWEEVVNMCTEKGLNKGLSEEFISLILSAIHIESINKQSSVMNKEELKKLL